MADTSPRTSRDSALAPSRPLLRPCPSSPPSPLFQPPTTSSLSAASSLDTPCPGPRMSGWRWAGPRQGACAGGRWVGATFPALGLRRVDVQSWNRDRPSLTHRSVRPITSPFALQKAVHHLRADFSILQILSISSSIFLPFCHPGENMDTTKLKFKAVSVLVNGSGRTGNYSRVLKSDIWERL